MVIEMLSKNAIFQAQRVVPVRNERPGLQRVHLLFGRSFIQQWVKNALWEKGISAGWFT